MGGKKGAPGNDKAFQEEGPSRARTGRRERAWLVWSVPSAWRHLGCKGVGCWQSWAGALGGWQCQAASEGQCVPGQTAQTQLQRGILPEGVHLLMGPQPPGLRQQVALWKGQGGVGR